jgi:hypothetical protein
MRVAEGLNRVANTAVTSSGKRLKVVPLSRMLLLLAITTVSLPGNV